MIAFACTVRTTHGTDDDRRWHAAHGVPCHTCWPDSGGLPPMPDSTAVYPTDVDWRAELLLAEFGNDIPDEAAA